MNILILGGSVFLGRHIVELAQAQGHELTLFNRGKHNPDLFPDVEKIRGDRRSDEDLDQLRGRRWDAVVDTSGYIPREVKASAGLLADMTDHYTFVSSVSVYSDNNIPHMDESGPVGTIDDPSVEEVTGDTYGPLKALCEEAAETAMPGRVCNVRAGLIVGPWDPSDRFTYWPHRIAGGGEVLAPGRPERPVQFVDVRDLALWIISMATGKRPGTYNATGPNFTLTMGALLNDCIEASGSDAQLVWATEKFLTEQGVGAWMEMPLWIPEAEGMDGFHTIDCGRAIANGLHFRPIIDTVRDTLEWDRTLPEGRELRAGITRERERGLLEKYEV